MDPLSILAEIETGIKVAPAVYDAVSSLFALMKRSLGPGPDPTPEEFAKAKAETQQKLAQLEADAA